MPAYNYDTLALKNILISKHNYPCSLILSKGIFLHHFADGILLLGVTDRYQSALSLEILASVDVIKK